MTPALLLIMALLLTFGMKVPAQASSGNDQVLLSDEAGLLSSEEADSILSQAGSLASKTRWDVRVISADDTGGKSAMEYAEDFFMDHYRIDNGFVCLIDMDNREIYVATSGDVIYYLTDDRIETILDDAYEYVSSQEYASAYEAMLRDIETFYDDGIEENTYTFDPETGKIVYYEPEKSIEPYEALISAMAGLLSALGLGGIVSSRYKSKGKKPRYAVKENSSLKLSVRRDQLVNRFVTTRHIPKSPPPSSGGGFGGGHQSTIHTGSGGHSFGGGGRKF